MFFKVIILAKTLLQIQTENWGRKAPLEIAWASSAQSRVNQIAQGCVHQILNISEDGHSIASLIILLQC